MKKSHLLVVIASLLGILPGWSQVPQLLNLQGRIVVDGSNFGSPTPETGTFRFALVDLGGGTTYWSNDGTSAAGSEPTDGVDLQVSNGHYSVLLGDATLTNMAVLPASVFSNAGVYIRTWFDGGSGSEQLMPDRRIAAVGYAMLAATVEDGAITTSKLANNSITGAKISPNTVDGGHITNGSISGADLSPNSVSATHIVTGSVGASEIGSNEVGSSELAPNSVQSGHILNSTILNDDIANNTINGAKLADILDLGSVSSNGALTLWGDGSNVETIRLFGASSQISTYGSDGLEQARIHGGSWGELLLNDNTPENGTLVTLGAHESLIFPLFQQVPGGVLKLSTADGLRAYLKASTASGGRLTLYQNDGNLGTQLVGDFNGAGSATVYQADGQPSMILDGTGNDLTLYQNDDDNGIYLDGDSGGAGLMNLYRASGGIGVSLDGDSAGAGYISVRNSGGSSRVILDGESTGTGGEIRVFDASGTETVELLGAETASGGGRVTVRSASGVNAAELSEDPSEGGGELWLYNAAGVGTVVIEAQEVSTDGAQINLYDSAGTKTMELDAEFGVGGPSRVTTGTVQITGGSDLSEQFEVSSFDLKPEPGMIVCIDPEEPGRLKPSSQSYDRTVAGIISGAGGIRTGLLMGQRDSVADGAHPIALTGRVYCKMDCSNGPIAPGDLITTSDVPGLGMKVTDHDRARGAIIGKAMTRLDEGTGLVLVLVSLQ